MKSLMLGAAASGLSPQGAEPFGQYGLLRAFDRNSFERDESVIYGLDSELRLIYCNPAWERFANANGAPSLEPGRVTGMALMGVVPAPLRLFYRRGYAGVLASGLPWRFTYECSSAEVERYFQMAVHASPSRDALVVVNSLVNEAPHKREGHSAGRLYRNMSGIIIMCAHCRRVKTTGNPGRWDWVPEYVERMPEEISHSLCPVCKELHFGAQLRG